MVQSGYRGVILALAMLFAASAAQAQQFETLVMDARTGKVIQASNADARTHPASLTKMMTLYIVFDQIRQGRMSLDQKVTVSPHAAAEPPSKLGLKAGQQIELRYLIRAAAIKSANDAATAMGEAVAGSEPAFAQLMNQYAKAMGMSNTSFKNANGLTREGHMSTARDMATLGRRLVYDFPQYYNIFSRSSTSAGVATVKNTNRRLLEAYPGADGIKTGYTKAAGFNLVSSAQRGDKRVIVALLGGKSTAARNAEVARLMDLGFAKMPQVARVVPPTPLRTTVAAAAPARPAVARATTVALADSPEPARGGAAQADRDPGARPVPRTEALVSRNSATIAAAIAEVNAEIAANQTARDGAATAQAVRAGRPMPRPGADGAAPAAVAAAPSAGSASTFAVAAAQQRQRTPSAAAAPAPIEVANAGSGTTGGNEWGVQLGAYRAKGDAERQLLTTALKDVPELSGGLRRVEAAKLQGVTVFRAQFVGLSQAEALGACATLARMQADCQPLAPGI